MQAPTEYSAAQNMEGLKRMNMTATTIAHDNDAAQAAYITQIDALHALVARLATYATEGVFDVATPDEVHWGHVGDLTALVTQLETAIAHLA
jgi:uncharacterized protein (DUF2236 family)